MGLEPPRTLGADALGALGSIFVVEPRRFAPVACAGRASGPPLPQYINVIAESPANSISGVAPFSSAFSTSESASSSRASKQIGHT